MPEKGAEFALVDLRKAVKSDLARPSDPFNLLDPIMRPPPR
jgi:hypothetical protein